MKRLPFHLSLMGPAGHRPRNVSYSVIPLCNPWNLPTIWAIMYLINWWCGAEPLRTEANSRLAGFASPNAQLRGM